MWLNPILRSTVSSLGKPLFIVGEIFVGSSTIQWEYLSKKSIFNMSRELLFYLLKISMKTL